jgi:hypothetical protein
MRFWELPGPLAFLDCIEDDLRQGKGLAILVPRLEPPNLLSALRERLNRSGWLYSDILSSDHRAPIDLIYEGLDLADPADGRRTLGTLLEVLPVGQVVIIDGLSTENLERWRQWVREYELSIRNISPIDRPLLILYGSAIDDKEFTTGTVAFTTRRWVGVLRYSDMFLYASVQVGRRLGTPPEAQLLAATIAKLAMWDVGLADRLLELEPDDLFQPTEILRKIASDYGWTSGMRPSWHSGTVDSFDGQDQTHSILLALGDPTQELKMRVWSSQASVILPVVELQRRAIVRRIRHRLRLPIEVDGVRISDPYDLEIGVLTHAARKSTIDQRIVDQLVRLRDIRNALAHLEVISADQALDDGLLVVKA